jgi:hypothetical protein
MRYKPRNHYPDYAVAFHLAELLLDGRPIKAGKHKLIGMSAWTDTPYHSPEPPSLREAFEPQYNTRQEEIEKRRLT